VSSQQESTLVPDEIYDLIRAAAAKLEGLAAYNKYEQDGQANAQLWQQLRQQDEQAVRQLLGQLHRMMHQPGFQDVVGAGGGG